MVHVCCCRVLRIHVTDVSSISPLTEQNITEFSKKAVKKI